MPVQHQRHGIAYVVAVVFGRPEAATAKLFVCMAGPGGKEKK